jgi:hypothetical protein
MNEGTTEFSPPHHIGSRDVHMRPGSSNGRQTEGGGTVSYGLDDGMIVEFFPQQVFLEAISKNLGHQIFQERIYTRIVMPGNRNTVWVHETKGVVYETVVDDESGEYHTVWDLQEVCDNGDAPEPNKYPNAWKRFMKKGISADTGIPIEQWGVVSRSYAESLKVNNIHTVEALASLSDQTAQGIMGAVKYRDLARAALDDLKRTAIVAKEQERASRFEELSSTQAKQIEALQQHVMALQSKLNGSEGPAAPGRMVGTAPVVATEIRKMSKANAAKKHRIPDADEAPAGPERRQGKPPQLKQTG